MKALFTGLMAILIIGLMILIGCVAGTAFGALAGLVVAFFFPATSAAVLTALGINLALWQVGAALGFVGMFVRTSVTQNNND